MTKLFSALFALAALGAALLVLAAPGGAVTAHAAKTKTVAVKDDKFVPKKVTIHKGGTVKWVWKGQNLHNVFVGKHHSKTQVHGSYKIRFKKTGTFKVYCSIHVDLGMKMTVKVVK